MTMAQDYPLTSFATCSYLSSYSVVMEMNHGMGNSGVVGYVDIDLPVVQEILGKVNAVRDIVTAGAPRPAVLSQ